MKTRIVHTGFHNGLFALFASLLMVFAVLTSGTHLSAAAQGRDRQAESPNVDVQRDIAYKIVGDRELKRLLEAVRRAWIEGVLFETLDGKPPLPVNVIMNRAGIELPWREASRPYR